MAPELGEPYTSHLIRGLGISILRRMVLLQRIWKEDQGANFGNSNLGPLSASSTVYSRQSVFSVLAIISVLFSSTLSSKKLIYDPSFTPPLVQCCAALPSSNSQLSHTHTRPSTQSALPHQPQSTMSRPPIHAARLTSSGAVSSQS